MNYKMKCPKCSKEGLKYIEKRPLKQTHNEKKTWKRTNFKVNKCKQCGFEGEAK